SLVLGMPRPPPRSTLFPYTTLFRSMIDQGDNDPRLKGYKTPEGVKVEIVAEDPVVVNPLCMAFANDSALYVLEARRSGPDPTNRSEEHTSELQSRFDLVCRLLLEKK